MNPLLFQKQLRENAVNLQDFAKDLKNWGDEMKKKENSETGIEVSSKNKTKKRVNSSKLHETSEHPKTKIGVTDYAAWDKFDVDAELEKLEDDIEDDSELTDECNNNIYDQAILEKEKGNKCVKNQNWDEAIICYTKAIEYYSYDPVFYANRALCYLKTGMYGAAEHDCNWSLKLDQTYVKALQRRAAARIEMNKFMLAEEDLLKVLQYEPKNIYSKRELEQLRAKMDKREEKFCEQRPISKFSASRNKSKNSALNMFEPNISQTSHIREDSESSCKSTSVWPLQEDIVLVKAVNKQPHLRSQKPLMRVKINDSNCEPKIKNITTKDNKRSETIKTWPVPNAQSYSINSDDLKIFEKKNPKQGKSIDDCGTINPKEEKNNSNKNLVSKINEKNVNMSWENPKTAVQFYTCWNNLKSGKEKYDYLKSINPRELPKIFLNSLESEVFSGMLEILADNYNEDKDTVASILQSLTTLKRFGTFVMFLTDSDKKNLWKLIQHIKETNQLDKVEIDHLIKKFEL